MLRTLYKFLFIPGLLLISSCSLNKDPLDSFSDVTQGVDEKGKEVVFKDKAAVQNHLQTLYRQMRDRQEHWYVDLLLIAESHADNAYAGTTGAEVLPFENNSIEGSNSVINRDWRRYLEDMGRANRLIVYVDSVADNSLSSTEINTLESRRHIVRGLVMFDMVRICGAIPVATRRAEDLTGENVEDVYDDYFPKQATEIEAYEQVVKDCTEALQYAPDNDPG